jgi:iron complex outermembrane recepter protein
MNIVQNCYQRGDVDACALIERDGAASTINPSIKRISIVNDVYVNVNSVEAQGIDFELSYRTDIDLFGGGETVGLRLLGNKLDYRTNRNSVGLVTHLEGQINLPEWNLMLAGNYARGPFTASLQARYEEGTVQSNVNNIFQTTLNRVRYDILNNDVASSTIVDGRIGYAFDAWNTSMNVYLTVNNLLNKDPVPMITAPDAGLTQATGNGVYGSLLGRRYTIGVNFDF